MAGFAIYQLRERVAEVQAPDERAALRRFAEENEITGEVRRDGAGGLYVGDAEQGRFRARVLVDQDEIQAWRSRYTHGQPFGMPVVLASAIEKAGGIR